MTAAPRSMSRRSVLKLLVGMAGFSLLPGRVRAGSETLLRRPIPSSGELLPSIGLGTSRVFDVDDSAAARAPLMEVIDSLVGAGGSVVDTSPMYGRAEEVVGDLMAQGGLRQRIFVATKVWTRGAASGREQMEESMRLLRVKVVDLMQVHNLLDWEQHLATLRDWKEAGRIRYLGITHYRVDAYPSLESIIRSQPLDFVQLNYSILTPAAEERLLPLAAEKGVAVLVNRPYENGAVFSRLRGAPLPGWAGELGIRSWGQFCLKWVLSNPAVTCVIPGTSKPRHMIDNLAAGFGALPDQEQRTRMRQYLLDSV